MAGGLLDDMVPPHPPLQQYSTEEDNMLTVPRHMLVLPGVSQHGINIAATPEDEKEKKRKIDAKYRRSCKKRKEELGINLQKLREENARLKRENRSCWEENNSMVQKLQSKEVAIGNLKREIGDSKRGFSNQKDLLETLSQNPFVQQLMLGPNQLEMVLLENERNMLCQNGKWDNWASERVELLNEIEKLRLRNMRLKMHNQALVDKMLNQNARRKHEKANHALLEEIRKINQRLIDTVVDISDEDVDSTAVAATAEGGEGTIVKCSFSAVALGPNLKSQYASAQMSPIQPLRLLVPTNYPDCSPILLDRFPVEVSKEYEDLSTKAKSRFSISLRSLSQPMSLGEIARTWDACARAVISEHVRQSGGGTFSSKYGSSENCLSAA